MAILTVAEYRSFSGITEAQMSDVQAAALCEAAGQAVEDYLGYPIERSTRTEFYAGTGTKVIILRGKPVHSVTSVYHDPGAYYGSVTNSFASDTLQVAGVDYALQVSSAPSFTGCLIRIPGVWPEFPRRREWQKLAQDFVPNFGDVKVVYVAGFSAIPANIKLATAQIVTKSAQFIGKGGPIYSEHLGDYSYKIAEGFLSGTPELGSARQLLARYKEVPW